MHDPKHLILRRALRVAVLVSATFFVTDAILGWSTASLAAAFACFSMLAFADFSGPRWNRLVAYLLLGLNGVIMVAVGSYVAQWQWVSIGLTFVVVLVISFSAVLRGYFAAATAAAILPWAFAVTGGYSPETIADKAGGWALGALVASFGAIILWPSYLRSELRMRLADVLETAADVITTMDSPDEFRHQSGELKRKVSELHGVFDGRLARPGGVTKRDRSMLLAVDETSRLAMTLTWTDVDASNLGPIDRELMDSTERTLRDCAQALRDGSVIPDPNALDAARAASAEHIQTWCEQKFDSGQADKIRAGVEASAHVRLACLSTQAMAVYVRAGMDPRPELRAAVKADRALTLESITFQGQTLLRDPNRLSPAAMLRNQLTFSSPWLRTAIRSAVALSATVGLVTVLGAQHGFWVTLGALVALKFDASGTMRTALQVFLGTIAGFAVGVFMLSLTVERPVAMWLLLPIAAFLASYTPGAISLIVGQAFFTVFVIDLVGLTTPNRLAVAEWRLADVLLGVAVSLLVSLLMWPHGVVPMLVQTSRRAVRMATAFMLASYEQLADGPYWDEHVDVVKSRALAANARAIETFDLAFSQRGPGLENTAAIIASINSASQLNHAAEVVSALAHIDALPTSMSATGDAMLAAAHRAGIRVVSAVEVLDADPGESVVGRDVNRGSLARLRATLDRDLIDEQNSPTCRADSYHEASRTAMSATFGLVWIAQFMWMADTLWRLVSERNDTSRAG